MEDGNADRVYVPGSAGNPAPPDRDVEPFWEPEELEAPVHGRPVPHEAPPAVPLPTPPHGAPGTYRPGERIPVPPPVAVPVAPHAHTPPAPPAHTPPAPPAHTPPGAPPAHAPPWPDPESPTSGAGAAESGVHSLPDSPWSQPPQRPAAPPALERRAGDQRVFAPRPGPQPPSSTPAPPRPTPPPIAVQPRPAPPLVAAPPEDPPHFTPPPPPPAEPPNGTVYRPGAPPPAHGAAAVPPRTTPRPPANRPPQPPTPPPADPFQDLPWVSDGTPTAEEFARRRMARPADPVATQGARAMLRKGTMGLVKLAPGKREQEYKQDVEMVRRNFGGLRQVTVVNPKGGAGKTVAVLLLAMTFGQKRGGYVLAWDNNETQGTLGMRAQQDFHARTVRDMMRDLHLFRGSHGRVGDLSQYVRAQGEGMFDVLASDESATAGEMLTADAFGEIREIVSRFYKLIFVDTGNNVRAQNWQAAMDATDQLVITMSARNDSAETAARMLDHLEQTGRQRLVRQAVSVVSMPPTRKDIDLPAIQRHFAARTRSVLLAPYEKLIDSGEPIRYGHLSNHTRDAWLKIAAAVAEGL
ncbi:MinD/ParA family ATP-binding protein [Actinoplanes solisilvae]|uniref:MinD/ParA family ATP-binding protein n=1 Tax=Actinoplanes solisilvae TaxID=2486853 RepID=UPI000FD9757D|nr:chromosome partitioning protein [Actinoplanes solisilvae]